MEIGPAGAVSLDSAQGSCRGNTPAVSVTRAGDVSHTEAGSGSRRDAVAQAVREQVDLQPQEQARVRELEQRDRKVRDHEAAHVSAGGGYVTGGPTYSYATGPDGKKYAVGGEVQIDTSAVPDNPSATIAKMQAVRRAAMAPAQPSGQDRAVAARAAQLEARARVELRAVEAGDESVAGATTRDGGYGSPATGSGPAALGTASQPSSAVHPTGSLIDSNA